MKIHIASDHAGFELKNVLVTFLQNELGHEIIDYGPTLFNEEDDYPNFITPVAKAVALDPDSRGIVLGGSGQGEAMCANKISGVRAALYYGGDERIVTLSREHNDANILSLGARFITDDTAKKVVALWLTTSFSNEERHIRRVKLFS
jgi:ribose 5-phosphate isomerase B